MRRLAILAAVLFVLSSAFPIAAGLARDTASFPRWWGALDVTLAFVLAMVAMAIVGRGAESVSAEVRERTYRAYRVLIHALLVGVAIFFLFGDRISWTNCLTGIVWRTWLLLYCLPAWLAALGDASPQPPSRG